MAAAKPFRPATTTNRRDLRSYTRGCAPTDVWAGPFVGTVWPQGGGAYSLQRADGRWYQGRFYGSRAAHDALVDAYTSAAKLKLVPVPRARRVAK